MAVEYIQHFVFASTVNLDVSINVFRRTSLSPARATPYDYTFAESLDYSDKNAAPYHGNAIETKKSYRKRASALSIINLKTVDESIFPVHSKLTVCWEFGIGTIKIPRMRVESVWSMFIPSYEPFGLCDFIGGFRTSQYAYLGSYGRLFPFVNPEKRNNPQSICNHLRT